jgi:CDP-glucose 4,6-dehydratase
VGVGSRAMEEMGLAAHGPADFWRGKRVLVTGHTGFKGSWLALWLQRRGAIVTGIGLPPATKPSLFQLARVAELVESHICDVRDGAALTRVVAAARPAIVLHLAAQALVRLSYQEPAETFATNVQGTANLLEAVRNTEDVRVLVVVTTDKVYRSDTSIYPYRETDALGGIDPYSASKAAAELVVASYKDAFLAARGVAVASVRAGNVIGGGDWSEDRLLPDAVRAWSAGRVLRVRSPLAVRPWQHVLEPLHGYLRLAEALWDEPQLAGPYNFGPPTDQAATVREVVELARTAYGSGEVEWAGNSDGPHEAHWLALEVAKARSVLGIRPRWSLTDGVERAIRWYVAQSRGVGAAQLCAADIDAYEAPQ